MGAGWRGWRGWCPGRDLNPSTPFVSDPKPRDYWFRVVPEGGASGADVDTVHTS